jgi:hypothetical protein
LTTLQAFNSKYLWNLSTDTEDNSVAELDTVVEQEGLHVFQDLFALFILLFVIVNLRMKMAALQQEVMMIVMTIENYGQLGINDLAQSFIN